MYKICKYLSFLSAQIDRCNIFKLDAVRFVPDYKVQNTYKFKAFIILVVFRFLNKKF